MAETILAVLVDLALHFPFMLTQFTGPERDSLFYQHLLSHVAYNCCMFNMPLLWRKKIFISISCFLASGWLLTKFTYNEELRVLLDNKTLGRGGIQAVTCVWYLVQLFLLEIEKGNQTEFFNWLGKDLQMLQSIFFSEPQKDETVLQSNKPLHHVNITMLSSNCTSCKIIFLLSIHHQIEMSQLFCFNWHLTISKEDLKQRITLTSQVLETCGVGI